MDNETAMKMLKFLLKEGGHLQIITDERSDVPEKELVARSGNPLADPRAYVLHDVVRLEGPDDAGVVVAWSAEGDRTYGYPASVLKRLTEVAQ